MRLSDALAAATDPATGWDARLWRRWAGATALGYLVVLALVWLLSWLELDALETAASGRLAATLVVAGSGAVLYGGVLGTLQWPVVRERAPMSRRAWVAAAVVPAFAVWAAIVVPATVHAEDTGGDLRVAYLLAVSQALALGPVIGFAQARALRPYTTRWRWWIAGNLGSWLIVYAAFWLLSLVVDGFDFAHGQGTPLEAFLMLLASAPLSGRVLLWVTAPAAARHADGGDLHHRRGRSVG